MLRNRGLRIDIDLLTYLLVTFKPSQPTWAVKSASRCYLLRPLSTFSLSINRVTECTLQHLQAVCRELANNSQYWHHVQQPTTPRIVMRFIRQTWMRLRLKHSTVIMAALPMCMHARRYVLLGFVLSSNAVPEGHTTELNQEPHLKMVVQNLGVSAP